MKLLNVLFSVILSINLLLSGTGLHAFAMPSSQALSPSNWQTGATGLKTTQNSKGQTAGLGFVITNGNWPSLTLRGGVMNADASYVGPRLAGPIGIPLGQIRVTGASGSFTSQSADWAHNTLTYSYSGGTLQLTASRMSAAVALQSGASSLTLFTGNVSRYAWNSTQVNRLSDAPIYPRYAAYISGGTLQVKTLSTTSTSLSGMESQWMLIWFGSNSHFVDSRKPLSYDWTLPTSDAYQADAPLLLVFQNKPAAIKHASGGGIELTFSSALGAMSILPIDGRLTRSSSETEAWATSFPQAMRDKINFWALRSCEFPLTATETYQYTASSDTTKITETFTFLPICSGGTRFAPLPPFLAIAMNQLPIQISATVNSNGNLNTEFGPMIGIDGASSYSWSMSGLRKYTNETRTYLNGSVPNELRQKLETEVQKIISSGHYAPWIFLDAVPVHKSRGDVYWANPADVLLHLIEIAEAVDNPSLKSQILQYLQSERNNYPPETVYNLSITAGKRRGPFSYMDGTIQYYWNPNATQEDTRQDSFLKDVPLYSFYALARYYQFTQQSLPASTWQKAVETLDRDMREQDWATFYWFANYQDRRVAVENANRHFAGMIGFIRLAQMSKDSTSEELARSLLLKAAVLRSAMAHYPRYLGSVGLSQLPPSPTWMPTYRSHPFIGYLYNYDWRSANDDSRQVIYLNQFAVDLNDYNYLQVVYNTLRDRDTFTYHGQDSPYLAAFRDITPELGRYLKDWNSQDVSIVLNKVKALYPHWFAAFAEGTLGWEHNLSHPIDSFQIFMAHAWILDTPGNTLTRYTDISWLSEGDFFYIQKLAEAVKQYRGVQWGSAVTVQAWAVPGNQSLRLYWWVYPDEDDGYTWRIDISGSGSPAPVTGIPFANRTYLFTGLSNYQTYSITVSLVNPEGTIIAFSPAIQVMPSDLMVNLPLVFKAP